MTDDLLDLIRSQEGLRLTAYICPAGYRTIGYGHRVPTLDRPPITEAQAEELLRADVHAAEIQALALAPRLTGPRLAALTDLVFNVGATALHGSGVLGALNSDNWPDAAARFRRWDKARVKGELIELPGLKARRELGARWIEQG